MKTIKILSCLTILSIIVSCEVSTKEMTADDYHDEARSEVKRGEYGKALHSIEEAIHLDSANADYYELRFEIYEALSDTLHAQADFEHTLALDTTDRQRATHLKAMIKWEEHIGNNKKAHELLEKELELFKDDEEKHAEIVEFVTKEYILMEDLEAATKLCNKTIKEHPKYAFPYKQLASIELEEEDWRHAIKHYKKYIALNETDDRALNNLGFCYIQVKDKRHAKIYFKKAAELGNMDACEQYRELSAKIRYTTSSECCDGSSSSSTGRGTCSHHGGVCSIVHTPYKEYTYQCR